uniref:RING finger protein 145-like n=1 Tax=Dermatophagoides pteronyssinus TaxID=6956 RepID=A0A6P6Y3D8_DERPT|nr:RING finger protein 145-like [Dermatophagoides pteronyssinus]
MNSIKNYRLSSSSMMIIDLKRIEIALLRMPGLFLIDNYFKYFHYNWSIRHRHHWNLLLSHFALLNGFLLLLLPISNLKRYYIYLICWITLVYLSRIQLVIDEFVPDFFESSFLDDQKSIFRNSDQAKNLSLFFIHFLFDTILMLMFRAPKKLFQIEIVGYCIVAIGYSTKIIEIEWLKILHTISYGIDSLTLLNYFFKNLSSFLIDMKILFVNILDYCRMEEDFLNIFWQLIGQIFIPFHFFLFWTITILTKIYYLQMFSTIMVNNATAMTNNNTDNNNLTPNESNNLEWIPLLLQSISLSPISLLSTSITVTYISCFILNMIKFYLNVGNNNGGGNNVDVFHQQQQNNNPHQQPNQQLNYRDHNGWEEGITTLLLTTIISFSDINDKQRLAIMIIISFIIISSLLQSILEISEPFILSLNSEQNHNHLYHLKIFSLCGCLFFLPFYITNIYSKIFPTNFWITIVFSTSLLISARVLDLIIIHCLFWWDSYRQQQQQSKQQQESSEYLDDLIYFIRFTTKFIEFFISISVVFVGIWETLENHSNFLNIIILIMHSYFNVWQRILNGLKSYKHWQQANCVVNHLRLVNIDNGDNNDNVDDEKNLDKINADDLCTICYNELKLTNLIIIITDCKHLFHRKCLKKWLTIQNRCPLCSTMIK